MKTAFYEGKVLFIRFSEMGPKTLFRFLARLGNSRPRQRPQALMSWGGDRLEVTEFVKSSENNSLLIPKVGMNCEKRRGLHCTPARSLLVPEAPVLPLGKLGMEEQVPDPTPAARLLAGGLCYSRALFTCLSLPGKGDPILFPIPRLPEKGPFIQHPVSHTC